MRRAATYARVAGSALDGSTDNWRMDAWADRSQLRSANSRLETGNLPFRRVLLLRHAVRVALPNDAQAVESQQIIHVLHEARVLSNQRRQPAGCDHSRIRPELRNQP